VTHAEEHAALAVITSARALLALMRRDAEANDANHAVIILDEPEVAALTAALAELDAVPQ